MPNQQIWNSHKFANIKIIFIKPFHATGIFLYPLKTSDNFGFMRLPLKEASDMKWINIKICYE